MDKNAQDELHWGHQLAACGLVPFMPINHFRAFDHHYSSETIIRYCVAVIQRLRGGYDCLLQRPGWAQVWIPDDRPAWFPQGAIPPSEGATKELAVAWDNELVIMPATMGGEDALREYVTEELTKGEVV
jgi:hypothetical protein